MTATDANMPTLNSGHISVSTRWQELTVKIHSDKGLTLETASVFESFTVANLP